MIKALCKNLIIMLITIQMARSKLQGSDCKVTMGRYQSLDLVLKYMNFHGLLKANLLSGRGGGNCLENQ